MKKKFFKKIFVFFVLIFMFWGPSLVLAEEIIPEVEIIEPEIIPSPVVENNITIRNGDSIIYDGKILFPEEPGSIDISGQSINKQSVLGLIYSLDLAEDSFSISDLSYNESFGSFLLNCITPGEGEALCYNWQYVVDGYYPNIGMDKNILSGGETIYLFFGQADRILINSNLIKTDEDLIVTTEKYDFENNQWLVKTGVTVGITQVNPGDPYSPIEIQSGLVDENGQKIFSSLPIGSYSAGIKVEDGGFSYYWPQENFEVLEATGGNGGGGSSTPSDYFSIEEAISFLLDNQNSDGSFSNDMYTDWVAIASASTNNGNSLRSKIYNYLINQDFESSIITDYERRAMALMALGINPYETEINYIKKITDAFNGEQIGDADLINDDIFGILVLSKAGYNIDDNLISKTLEFIISQQQNDGSFGSVDLTSAFIQAVKDFQDVEAVNEAVSLAENYLISNEQSDGGYGNSFSTSWVLQALSMNNSFGGQVDRAVEYLTKIQQPDGGVGELSDSLDNRIWATSYAIPAIQKISWNDILESFSKVENFDSNPIQNQEETINEEELAKELPPIIIQEEIVKTEKILLDQEIKKVKNKITKNNIQNVTEFNESQSNALMASAIGANQEGRYLSLNINDFFQKILNFLKGFWLSLISLF